MLFPNIRNLREDNDKKQTELADYLHIKQTTYSKYELGKINIPIDVLIQLADFYEVSVDYLVGRTKHKNPPCSVCEYQKQYAKEIKKTRKKIAKQK